jgi:PTS system D-glucosamine-specific IIC component
VKLDLKTPGRDDSEEVKLYRRSDVEARKNVEKSEGMVVDELSRAICNGLGGKRNISDVDCCATRLRCTVYQAELVNDELLKSTGASGVVHKGNGVQIIYGPRVTVIKSNLEDYLETVSDVEPTEETKVICSPVNGIAAELSTAPDEAFAQKLMGDGVVVKPTGKIVSAPEDGEVCFIFETKHAIGFVTDSGVSLLLHMGIDTVKLNGEGFKVFVKSGQKVKKGEPLMELDLAYLNVNAPSMVSPILCTELEEKAKNIL